MTIHTIQLNWNQKQEVLELLDKLRSWDEFDMRYWIVDNASTQSERIDTGAQPSKVTVLANEANLGYAGGVNTALRAIYQSAEDNDHILLINNDVEVQPRCVQSLIDALEQNEKTVMAGPVLVEGAENNIQRSWGGKDIGKHLRTRITQAPAMLPKDGLLPVDYVPGTVLLLRVGSSRTIGLLDEDYFFSGEIADFAARAKQKGLRCVICTDAEARHFSHDERSDRDTLYRYYSVRNRFLYAKKHHTAGRLFWTLTGCAVWLSCILGGRLKAARATALAIADGCNGRFGNQNERLKA